MYEREEEKESNPKKKRKRKISSRPLGRKRRQHWTTFENLRIHQMVMIGILRASCRSLPSSLRVKRPLIIRYESRGDPDAPIHRFISFISRCWEHKKEKGGKCGAPTNVENSFPRRNIPEQHLFVSLPYWLFVFKSIALWKNLDECRL